MNEDVKNDKQALDEEALEAQAPEAGEASDAETADDETEALKKALEAAKREIESLKDSRLRLMAEYENYKRRTQKEKDKLYGDSLADVTAAWLPVLDNLDRAALSASRLDDKSEFEAIRQVAEGIELVRKQAVQSLDKIGVREIEALNKPFDPELHEAVMRVDSDDTDQEIVVEVFAKGYIFGDRVIRHSVVKVAN